jgi:hypothetical protein
MIYVACLTAIIAAGIPAIFWHRRQVTAAFRAWRRRHVPNDRSGAVEGARMVGRSRSPQS